MGYFRLPGAHAAAGTEVNPALKLGLELHARHATTLRLGTFFETWLATPDGTVRRSLGRDEYHLELTIGPGHRLAATGRTHICQLDLEEAGLGINQARPALPAVAPTDPTTPVIWGVRTNRFLDLASLAEGTSARLLREGAEPLDFGLDHHLLKAEEVAPGRYILDITTLLFA